MWNIKFRRTFHTIKQTEPKYYYSHHNSLFCCNDILKMNKKKLKMKIWFTINWHIFKLKHKPNKSNYWRNEKKILFYRTNILLCPTAFGFSFEIDKKHISIYQCNVIEMYIYIDIQTVMSVPKNYLFHALVFHMLIRLQKFKIIQYTIEFQVMEG